MRSPATLTQQPRQFLAKTQAVSSESSHDVVYGIEVVLTGAITDACDNKYGLERIRHVRELCEKEENKQVPTCLPSPCFYIPWPNLGTQLRVYRSNVIGSFGEGI